MSRLLSTEQMASFVARGFLRFDALVPDELNRAAVAELSVWAQRPFERPCPATMTPFEACYADGSAIGEVLRLDGIVGIVKSLVGPGAVFDHDWIHLRQRGDALDQRLHADAIIDDTLAFDLQLFYFPTGVGPGEGGTRFVPGTHLRRVNESDIARYQHLAGMEDFVGPAGSVLVFHHGLWHSGRGNVSGPDRLMYKLRLNPSVPQVRLWDAGDLEERQNGPDDHIFARFDRTSVAAILRRPEPWWEQASGRLDLLQRARLWRYVSGDDSFDVDYYLTRTERRQRLVGS